MTPLGGNHTKEIRLRLYNIKRYIFKSAYKIIFTIDKKDFGLDILNLINTTEGSVVLFTTALPFII